MDTTNLQKIKLKLVVDKASDKVLFAEADSTFVDFLIYTLSLPLSAVGAYLPDACPGSIGKLRRSLSSLDESHYIERYTTRSSILTPHLLTHVPFLRRLTGGTSQPVERLLYSCPDHASSPIHSHRLSDALYRRCGICNREMTSKVMFGDSSRITKPAKYVKDVVKYMVTDELSVLPLDSTAVFGAVKLCGNPGDVMEKYVEFGPAQALEMIKAVVVHSDKVLTSVFLPTE